MKEKRLCYISRTYYNLTSAGNKAKTDYEKVLHSMGAVNIGLPCRINKNKFLAFFYNLTSIFIACSRIRTPSRSTRLPVASSRCWKKPSTGIHLIIYGRITDGSEPGRSLTSNMKSKMVK